jgi:hypothetical protein
MRKAVNHLRKSDAILASIIARVGPCKMDYRDPTFEMLARAIVFQQLSTKAARTIYGRLEEAAGGALTPESIQNLSVGEMRRAGLSRQKLGYIRDLAEHALSGKVDFSKLPGPIKSATCQRRNKWSRSQKAGIHIAATLRGICGGAWNCRRKNPPQRHGDAEKSKNQRAVQQKLPRIKTFASPCVHLCRP